MQIIDPNTFNIFIFFYILSFIFSLIFNAIGTYWWIRKYLIARRREKVSKLIYESELRQEAQNECLAKKIEEVMDKCHYIEILLKEMIENEDKKQSNT